MMKVKDIFKQTLVTLLVVTYLQILNWNKCLSNI